jgi:3-phytase/alkaline phosphatase D
LLAALAVACGPAAPERAPVPPLTYLGEAIIAPEPEVSGDPGVGGLSAIFHAGGDTYYAISDDRGLHGPARYYVLNIDLSDGHLDDGDALVTGWRPLLDPDGRPLRANTYDLEGLVAYDQTLFVASEGDTTAGVEPFVAVFDAEGRLMEPLGLPPGFETGDDRSTGVRNNLAFESLAITPNGRYLFTGTESALLQDGPEATPAAGTMSRLLRFDRIHGVFDAEFAYPIEPVHATSAIPGGLEVNGLSELLAFSGEHLLALERSFVAGALPQHSIKLFDVCLADATDVSAIASLAHTETAVTPASKRLIGDIADLAPRLDNLEGMTLGPTLPSGEQTLIFISDDNFSPQHQITQVLAFALADDAIRNCSSMQ